MPKELPASTRGNLPGIAANSNATVLRTKHWFRQLFQYTIVGAIATACDLAVFIFLIKQLEINYLLATPLSFIAGAAVSFLLCLKFVFHLKRSSWTKALWRKLLASLIALAVNLSAMFVMVDILMFDQINFEAFEPLDGLLFARGLAICLAFFINFTLTKYYAFQDY